MDNRKGSLTRSSDSMPSLKCALAGVLVSAVLLVPCFWHPRIEAGDLASHAYNAWLTMLVHQGKAPGLRLATQANNVLFDILLFRACSLFGFIAGEKVSVSIAVLVFFWGAFTIASSASKRPAWFLAPLLVALSWGWTMEMGFFNFYLALGLSFFALAALWRGRPRDFLFAAFLCPVIWLAHPLGAAWFGAMAIYVVVSRLVQPRWQWILTGIALVTAIGMRLALASQYQVTWWMGHFYDLNGSDQLSLGTSYHFLPICLLLAVLACVALHVLRTRGPVTDKFPVSLQLFVICFLGLALIPDAISLPSYSEPVSLISSRFTLAVAVMACCALATLRPRILFAALTGILALCYFAVLYTDTGKTYAMENQAAALVAQLPQDAHVVATIFPFRGSRVFVHHVVDRACIGKCFVVDNYEPASGQFRLRAESGSLLAAANSQDANRMMLGIYNVRSEDLPLWQIFQCGPWEIDLCLRPLQAGPILSQPPMTVVRARPLQP